MSDHIVSSLEQIKNSKLSEQDTISKILELFKINNDYRFDVARCFFEDNLVTFSLLEIEEVKFLAQESLEDYLKIDSDSRKPFCRITKMLMKQLAYQFSKINIYFIWKEIWQEHYQELI